MSPEQNNTVQENEPAPEVKTENVQTAVKKFDAPTEPDKYEKDGSSFVKFTDELESKLRGLNPKYQTIFMHFYKHAAYKDYIRTSDFDEQGNAIFCKRGEYRDSVRTATRLLSSGNYINKGTVERAIKTLIAKQLITKETRQGRIAISIVDYDKYNPPKKQNKTPSKTISETLQKEKEGLVSDFGARHPPKTIDNNINIDTNKRNEERESEIFSPSLLFKNYFNNPMFKNQYENDDYFTEKLKDVPINELKKIIIAEYEQRYKNKQNGGRIELPKAAELLEIYNRQQNEIRLAEEQKELAEKKQLQLLEAQTKKLSDVTKSKIPLQPPILY